MPVQALGIYVRREDGKEKLGMPYMPLKGAKMEQDGLIEVAALPTGFIKIKRCVIEQMAAQSPQFDNKKKRLEGIPLIFERVLKNGARIGGDINFCLKWRGLGGRIYALYDLVLGHAAKTILKDSLGAFLRRQDNQTLSRIANLIKQGNESPEDYQEAFDYIGNPWGANDETLIVATTIARKSTGAIIETGSGLSTVLMAAANTGGDVYAIEHNDHFKDQTVAMAQVAGVENIYMVCCEIKDDWYDLDGVELPERFSLGLNDGPPRQLGDRKKFFDIFGDRCDTIVCDDADDKEYSFFLKEWAKSRGRDIIFPESRSCIILEPKDV